MKKCPKCSLSIHDSYATCPNCGADTSQATPDAEQTVATTGQEPAGADDPWAPPRATPVDTASSQGEPPKKYTVQGILLLLFCCWPFAIPVLVYSSKVDKLWYQGLSADARDASDKARKWMFASFFTGILVQGIAIILLLSNR